MFPIVFEFSLINPAISVQKYANPILLSVQNLTKIV